MPGRVIKSMGDLQKKSLKEGFKVTRGDGRRFNAVGERIQTRKVPAKPPKPETPKKPEMDFSEVTEAINRLAEGNRRMLAELSTLKEKPPIIVSTPEIKSPPVLDLAPLEKALAVASRRIAEAQANKAPTKWTFTFRRDYRGLIIDVTATAEDA